MTADSTKRPNGLDPEALALRLAIGYQRIDDARAAGLDTAALEEFWLTLLQRYDEEVELTDRLNQRSERE